MSDLKQLRGALRKKFESLKSVSKSYPKFSMRDPKIFIVLPSFKDVTKIDFKYPLVEPFVYAHIKWVSRERKLMYLIQEPEMSKKEKEMIKKIENNLIEIIDVKISDIKIKAKAMEYIEEKVRSVIDDIGLLISADQYMKVMYYIIRDFVGLNEIEPIMHDPYIEDIGCTGINSPIFVIHRRFGSVETNLVYSDFDYFSNFIIKLSERCGRYISYATPLLDGSLPDGSRVQASLAKDVTTKGPTFSIRKFRRNPYSPIDLINLKTTSSEVMAYLWFLLQNNVSILITGGVSTGKTTTLNVLSMFIPAEDKIISIEDTREINLPHENWIPSVSRSGFGIPDVGGKKYGEITLFNLLKESFRQNPDYVIVGEVRGEEAYVMFQGMASGHPSLGTIHAGSVDDVIKRLETPPIELSPTIIEALDMVIVMTHAKEKGKSARRMKEINEIQSMDMRTGKAHTVKTFSWIPSVDILKNNMAGSELLRRISFQKGMTHMQILEDIKNRKKVIEWMKKYDVVQFDEVARIINIFQKDRETLMKWVDKGLPPYKTKSRKVAEKIWQSATGLKVMEA